MKKVIGGLYHGENFVNFNIPNLFDDVLICPLSYGRVPADFLAQADLRFILVESNEVDPKHLSYLVESFREKWPLIDILVIDPSADAKKVLEIMKLKISDMVLSWDATELFYKIKTVVKKQQFLPKVSHAQKRWVKDLSYEGVFSKSPKMWDLFEQVEHVARTDANVLILGETGTGKELLARAIHNKSMLDGKFVAVNCAAIPEQLLDSELFGHVKGAFTGAINHKKGLFEMAKNGSLLLDEIGLMSLQGQHHLLRVLQEKVFRPVGAVDEVKSNARVIAATSSPLEDAVAKNNFKEDLLYRLDVVRFVIPPLRERPEDIIFLFTRFVKKCVDSYGLDFPSVSDGFLESIANFHWPGNVRQLENIIERLLLAHPNKKLLAEDFERVIRPFTKMDTSKRSFVKETGTVGSDEGDWDAPYREAIEPLVKTFEKKYFTHVLRKNRFRMGLAAKQAGIDRKTLLRKLKAIGLDKNDLSLID